MKGKEIYIKVTFQPWVLKIMVLLDLGPAPFILWLCWANQENLTQTVNIGLWVHRESSVTLILQRKKAEEEYCLDFLICWKST